MAWTTPQDVLDRWVGSDRPTDEGLLETLIGDAEDHIVFEFPDVPARIASDDLPLVRVQRVVAAMVARVVRNPRGVRQVQRSTGPFQVGETFAEAKPGEMTLTDEERSLLGYGPKAGRQQAFTIVPTGRGPVPDAGTTWILGDGAP